jgi:hypothetical protein
MSNTFDGDEAFDAGVKAGRLATEAGGVLWQVLSEDQLRKLDVNLDKIYNRPLWMEEDADVVAEGYAALTGDRDLRERRVAVEFWRQVLGEDVEGYSQDFFNGFLQGVAEVVAGLL